MRRQYVKMLMCLVGLLLLGIAPSWGGPKKSSGMTVQLLVRELELDANGEWSTVEKTYVQTLPGKTDDNFMAHALRPWANQLENVLELKVIKGLFWKADWNQMREFSNGLRNLRSFIITKEVDTVEDMEDYEGASTLNQACRYLEVHKLKKVGNNAFFEAQLETVLLPDVQRIGKRAFHGNTRLATLNIEHAKFIGAEAFRNCVLLNSVSLHWIDSIDHSAFKGCHALNYAKIRMRVEAVVRTKWDRTQGWIEHQQNYRFPYCNMDYAEQIPQHYAVFSECAGTRIVIPCDEKGVALSEEKIRWIFGPNGSYNHPHMEWDVDKGWQGFDVGINSISVTISPDDKESGKMGFVYAPPQFMPGSNIELKPFLREGYTLKEAKVTYNVNGNPQTDFVDGRIVRLPNNASDVRITWKGAENKMNMRVNGKDIAGNSIRDCLQKLQLEVDQVESMEIYGGCVEECDWRTMALMYKAESIRVKPTVDYCAPARSTRTSLGSNLRWDKAKYLEFSKMEEFGYYALGLQQLVNNDEIKLELFPDVTYCGPASLLHKHQKVRVVGFPANPPTYRGEGYEIGELGTAYLVPVNHQGIPLEGSDLEKALDAYANGKARSEGWNGRRLIWYRAKVEESPDGVIEMDSPFGVYGKGETAKYVTKAKPGKQLTKAYYKNGSKEVIVGGVGMDRQFAMPQMHVTILTEWGDASYEVNVDGGIKNGKVTTDPQSANYQQKITVTCKADDGYRLKPNSVIYKYTDPDDGKEKTGAATAQADGTYTFEMPNTNVVVSAEFESLMRYKIMQDPAMTNGRVKVYPESEDYPVNSRNIFKAVPNQGFLVKKDSRIEYALASAPDNWMEIVKKPHPLIPSDSAFVLQMPESDIFVRAQFEENPNAKYKVTVDAKYADGMMAALPTERLAMGDTVRLKLVPPRGVQFNDIRYCEGDVPSGPWKSIGTNTWFLMPESNVFITADTVANPNAKWSVTIDPSVPEGFLSPEPKEKIEWGERVYIRQTYDPRVYDLVPGSLKWSRKTDPPEWKELDNSWTFLMPESDVVITAKFETKPGHELFTVEKEVEGRGTLTVLANGEPLANGSTVRMNTDIEIVTEPADGYVLNKVILNGEEYREGKFTITVQGNITMKAYFAEGETTDVAAQHPLTVSPNPFGNELHIAGEGIKRVTMYSMMGLEVLRISYGFDHVSTQHLPAGVYVMRVEWQDGSVSTHRLVRK